MIRSTPINHSLKYLYFFLIILMYFLFIYLDLLNTYPYSYYSRIIKYSSIIIFFTTSLLIGNSIYTLWNTRLLQIALFFTLCADTCLLLLDCFKLGIFFFCIVQILYIIRHSLLFNINKNSLFTPAILVVTLPLILNFVKPEKIDSSLFKIAIIYAVLLITSLLVALKSEGLIPYALVLFFLCDINVALSHIFETYPMSIGNIELSFITGFLVWIFYLPSQLLLTLSGFKDYGIVKINQ